MPHHNTIWQSDFSTTDWLESWNTNEAPMRGITFGEENISVENDGTRPEDSFLRIRYPQGSWSPNDTRNAGLPVGGAQFYGAVLNGRDITDVTLKYSIRFPNGFQWVLGGKLPGLYGGRGNTGNNHPNGRDGFTTRYMWRENGKGILYPFLPTTPRDDMGTTFILGDPLFAADNNWHTITQRVVLNTVGQDNGCITVWYDDQNIPTEEGLRFRTVDSLKIDGILFQTFFGGGSSKWATLVDTYVDFANFQIYA